MRRGVLKLKIEGAGWPTALGSAIVPADPATIEETESGRKIRWNLPESTA